MNNIHNPIKNLYDILNINKDASQNEIKKSYRKLALIYHPDKNKDPCASELFNQIKVSYDILSNPESRLKYDSLNELEHQNLINILYNFVKSIINPENINKLINIICNNELSNQNQNNDTIIVNTNINDIPNYDSLKTKIETRIKDKNNIEYINNFINKLLEDKNNLNKIDLSVFYSQDDFINESPNNKDEKILKNNDNIIRPISKIKEKKYNLMESLSKSEYSISSKEYNKNTLNINNNDFINTINNNSQNTNTTSTNDINIYGTIKTNLKEVYLGIIKEINVKRQIIEDKIVVYQQYKYNIPLNIDQVTLEKQGDNYYDDNHNIISGDLIIDIKCKKHPYFNQVNDYDILVSLSITLNELFNGFNKTFDYFPSEINCKNNQINIYMMKSFSKIYSNYKILKQSKFDGTKIILVLENLGIIKNDNINNNIIRGNLIIYLVLVKPDNFNNLIKQYFD